MKQKQYPYTGAMYNEQYLPRGHTIMYHHLATNNIDEYH
jgi:hypothetical protein